MNEKQIKKLIRWEISKTLGLIFVIYSILKLLASLSLIWIVLFVVAAILASGIDWYLTFGGKVHVWRGWIDKILNKFK